MSRGAKMEAGVSSDIISCLCETTNTHAQLINGNMVYWHVYLSQNTVEGYNNSLNDTQKITGSR